MRIQSHRCISVWYFLEGLPINYTWEKQPVVVDKCLVLLRNRGTHSRDTSVRFYCTKNNKFTDKTRFSTMRRKMKASNSSGHHQGNCHWEASFKEDASAEYTAAQPRDVLCVKWNHPRQKQITCWEALQETHGSALPPRCSSTSCATLHCFLRNAGLPQAVHAWLLDIPYMRTVWGPCPCPLHQPHSFKTQRSFS